jgi:hypothetical protein
MFKTLLEEYQLVQNQNKTQAVKEIEFDKPFAESKLYELSSQELSEMLYEERRKSYLIPKGSIQETKHHRFVEEAVAILEFVQSAGSTFVNSIKKSKEAHDGGDSAAAKAHFKNAKKSRYSMNEKDLDRATPHFKAYKELQKKYDDKAGVAESEELDEASTDLAIHKSRTKINNITFSGSHPELASTVAKIPTKHLQALHADGMGTMARHPAMGHIEKELKSRGKLESVELDELSTDLLGRYKTAASKSASAADAKMDFKTGNKRFSGIMKATNKQFDNDMKKLKKESSDIELDEASRAKAHPLEGHPYHEKSDDELTFIGKDAHAAAQAMKDHSPKSEAKYLDQAADAATVRYWRKKNGTPDWYKSKYGHNKVKESVEYNDAARIPPNHNK